MLTNPFPQGKQLVVGANQNPGASSRGTQEGEIPSNIFMMSAHADIATRSRDYGGEESSKAKEVPDATEPLHITKPIVESMPRMPKHLLSDRRLIQMLGLPRTTRLWKI